jgi:shikimate dehydrogenase
LIPQRYGIVGQNIGYSKSPHIHKLSAAKLGLNITYEIFEPKPSDLGLFIETFFANGGMGLNVTTPYKSSCHPFLTAADAMAVNTIISRKGGLLGLSTDGPGFERAVSQLGRELVEYEEIFFLGAGGAARSVIEHLTKLGYAGTIKVARRDPSLDSDLVGQFPILAGKILEFNAMDIAAKLTKGPRSESTLLVQATSAPNSGSDLSELLPSINGFAGSFVDMVYAHPTAIFRTLQAAGNPCQDGLPMLIEQARLCQEYWWGLSLGYTEIYQLLTTPN